MPKRKLPQPKQPEPKLDEEPSSYAQEPHIAPFYHRRSQIVQLDIDKDICIGKDGNAYCAMIGVNLQEAKHVAFGNSEIHALMMLVEERAGNHHRLIAHKTAAEAIKEITPIQASSVYCVGVFD